MKVVGHVVKDAATFHAYFSEDGPARSVTYFIENHCEEVFTGRLSNIPSAFALPKKGGGTIEAGVVMDIMDVTSEEPVLHLVLEIVDEDAEVEGKVMS